MYPDIRLASVDSFFGEAPKQVSLPDCIQIGFEIISMLIKIRRRTQNLMLLEFQQIYGNGKPALRCPDGSKAALAALRPNGACVKQACYLRHVKNLLHAMVISHQ